MNSEGGSRGRLAKTAEASAAGSHEDVRKKVNAATAALPIETDAQSLAQPRAENTGPLSER
ncbi:MAG: hypothetical protein ABJF23_22085 [Bryobacteraceae bacterium]